MRILKMAGLAVATYLVAPGLALAQDGGTVTIVLAEEPSFVEPCEASRSDVGKVLKQNVVETLTQIDPTDGGIAPRLATAWEQVDDLTWRFSLREGVTFHDGAAFDAEAVKHSIDRMMDTSIDCEIRTKFFGGTALEVTPVDELTVDIKTDAPSPILPTMMGTVVIVSPNTAMGEYTRSPVGTGPYTFEAWDVGNSITLSRFDGYWGDMPAVEGAKYIFRSESPVRAAMVAAGEADIAPNISVQDADPAADFSYPNSETTRLRIDTETAPLDDIRIREALNLAVDRSAIKGTILSPDVMLATQLVAPSINGHNPDIVSWGYDVEKARALIAQAKADGTPVDSEIHLIGRTGMFPNSAETMEALQAFFQDAGFNVSLRMVEVGEWLELILKPYAEDRPPILLIDQHDNNNGDAVFTVFNKYHSEGANSTLHDEELDRTIRAAEQATGDERRKLFQKAFSIIEERIIADVMLFHMVGYTRVSERLSFTPDISTNSELPLEKISFK
ncbi:ABC transporter substrate-binding protein [Oricola thermophila]|uniref:Peptide ABC transporter substrate-binding protein n=1 Tax=Oricola thermophila TaxID=2742145 RepID=A0A6N1VCP5_9HYPH|nr:ABC transporter substrate-binding protein [Oricola thermophila]QKV18303.1 peptide ABC transporter substrate-binding protein [Oricola thermophila]